MSTQDLELVPIKTTVVRYKCPHCGRHHPRRAKAVEHIGRCFKNPASRTCRTCVFYKPATFESCGIDTGIGICDCGSSPEECKADVELPGDGMPVVGCEKWEAIW